MRGIETRRRDTPEYFKKCQLEILGLFSRCKTVSEIKDAISEARFIQKQYKERLLNHEVPLEELTFTNRITKGAGEYKAKTIQADAVNQLRWEGNPMVAGQNIRYIIHDYWHRKSKRVVPIEIIQSEKYDEKRYSELLDEYCKSVIEPFEQYSTEIK